MSCNYYSIGGFNSANLKVFSQKICNIQTNSYTTTVTAVALPTSIPGTPTISQTLAQSDFPSFSGNSLVSCSYLGLVLAGVANTNAGSTRTLNWQVNRNGSSIGTGSQAISASNKGVLNFCSLLGANAPQVGDVIDIYLWCSESATDLQFNRYGRGILPIRIKPVNDPTKLLYGTSYTYGNFGISNFSTNYGINYYYYKFFSGSITSFIPSVPSNSTFSGFGFDGENPVYGLTTHPLDYSGGNNSVQTNSNSYYINDHVPLTQIKWRETNIRYLGT